MLNAVNVSLGLISVLLILTLFGLKLPTLGYALYALDKDEPLIIVNWQENYETCQDINRCCLEIISQTDCSPQREDFPDGEVNWVCHSNSGLRYFMNSKAYLYCQQQPWK